MRALYSEKNLPHWKSALRPQTAELSLIPLPPKKRYETNPNNTLCRVREIPQNFHRSALFDSPKWVLEIIRQVTVIGLEATTCCHPRRRRRR